MAAAVLVSIAVCTRNRAEALRRTLAALARTELPCGIPAEVLIVDNGSTDGTRDVAASFTAPGVAVRYLAEPRPGVAHARNAALVAARGDVILFLDDDVRPPSRWLEPMCRPILAGAADAVAGGVHIPPSLERSWMEPLHRAWLADTGFIDPHTPHEMVSANMAIGRHVLARVPGFDHELGPGALGQGEDALFSWQLLHAGFRIGPALDVAVEHHFDPHRLVRRSFRDTAERRGRALAYQDYHWKHVDLPDARRRLHRRWVRFLLARARDWRSPLRREGMATWEMLAREQLAFLRQWQVESARPRNYERFGLVKRAAP
jgi:glycosyltransferase involved in cell wall biosynthesis